MKPILLFFLLGLSGLANAQQEAKEAPPEIATLKRSITGRVLNDRGLSTGQKALLKDSAYKVVRKELGYAILNAGGETVSVPLVEVTLTPGRIEPAVSRPAPARVYTPAPSQDAGPLGSFVLISAKYSLDGNQPRNVKNKVSKIVPDGEMTKHVSFVVSDNLSSAASLNDRYHYNVLTVIYTLNGEMKTKVVGEGYIMTLP